jgi:long-chain acyl-CoA synthetase
MAGTLTPAPWLAQYDPEVPHHLIYPDITVVQMFQDAAAIYPEQTCLVFKDFSITYRQMDELTDRLSAGFASLGVKKGDRLGILLNNIPQFVLAYFAALKSGAVVVATNPLYKPNEIIAQVNDAGVEVLVVSDPLFSQVKQFQAQTGLRTLIVTQEDDLIPPASAGLSPAPDQSPGGKFSKPNTGDYELLALLRGFSPAERPQVELSPEDPALFQYSGGTTGISKAAIALHRNLVANAIQFRRWLHHAQDGKETMLMAIPLYHVYGMVVGMLVSIQTAARMVLIPSPRDLDAILFAIQNYHVSLFPGVPNLYQAIISHPDVRLGKYNLSSIKACISGSAPLLPDTKTRFEALTGGKLVEGYGLSEAPTATHCNPIFGLNPPGSIGLPLPDVSCRIVSPEDGFTDLPAGEAGELLIRGPQVMQGYHNMPDETALTLRDGWLYTGDIARIDERGYFYLVDRKKDVIKPGGFQVWPREVEEVLAQHPNIAECCVAGVLHPERGEIVKAWVVLKQPPPPGATAAETQAALDSIETELRDFCRNELAPFKVPALIEFRAELPRTPVGKILRRELVRQHYLDHAHDAAL